MKKLFLLIALIFSFIIVEFIIHSKITLNKNWDTKNFSESNFNKEYYSSNKLILIDVWATWCSSCISQFPELEKFQNNKSVKFISFSIDEDTIKLKKYLNNNPIVYSRDVTLKNINCLDSILQKIEFSGSKKKIVGLSFEAKKIPYIVLIKNKKILYKAGDDLKIDSLNTIIQQNQ